MCEPREARVIVRLYATGRNIDGALDSEHLPVGAVGDDHSSSVVFDGECGYRIRSCRLRELDRDVDATVERLSDQKGRLADG